MVDSTSTLRLVIQSTGVRNARRNVRGFRNDVRGAERSVAQLRNAVLGLGGALVGAFSVRGLANIADQYTQIQNQLRLVTGGTRDLERATAGVLRVSTATGASIDGTTNLFRSLTQFAGEIIGPQEQVLQLTQAINQAAAISGATVQEAANASRQLGQALAGGVLRAEEFNAIIEQNSRLGQAIADGLGIGIGELRRQVNEGLVTSEKLVTALRSQLGTLDEEFSTTTRTIGQALENLRSTVVIEFGERLQGAQALAVEFIEVLTNNLPMVIQLFEALTAAAATYLALNFAGAAARTGVALAANIATMIRLEKALGATSTASALFAASMKTVQGAIRAVTAALLANPFGLFVVAVTAAVGAIVFFRDEIAQALFGVQEFSTVVQATFDVLGPKVEAVLSATRSAVGGVVESVSAGTAAFVGFFSDIYNRYEEQIDGFLEFTKSFALAMVSIFVELAKRIAEVLTDALLLPLRGIEAVYQGLANIDLLPDGLQSQLQAAADSTRQIRENIDSSFGGENVEQLQRAAESVINGISIAGRAAVSTYEEIRQRAQEIEESTAGAADAAGELNQRVQGATTSATQLSAEAKKAKEALAAVLQQQEDQRELIEAARLGEREEEIAREILRLRSQITDQSDEYIRNLAEANVDLREQLDIIKEQRDTLQAPFENLADNLEEAILNGGRAGVGGLGDIFDSFLNDLKRSFLQTLFQPIRQAFNSAIQGIATPNGIFGGGIGPFTPGINGPNPGNAGFGGLFSGLSSLFNPQTLVGLGGLGVGGIAGNAFGLASLIGPANLGIGAAQIGNFLGLPGGVTDIFGEALAGAGTFTGALGGIGGSLLSGAIFGNSTGQQIGSTIGGIAGSLIPIPVVGNLIGSFIGGAIGSLFGRRTATGSVDLSTGEAFGFKDSKRDSRNERRDLILNDTTAALQAIAQAIGGTLGGSLEVNAGKRSISTSVTGIDGRTIRLSVDDKDVEGAVANAITSGIEIAIQGGSDELRDLATALADARVPIQDIVDSVQAVGSVLDFGQEELSRYGQALQQLNQAFDKAEAAARGVASAENAVSEARERAIGILRDQFNEEVSDRLLQQTDPLRFAFENISDSISTLIKDAESLGVDTGPGSDVAAVITNDLNAFFDSAIRNGASLDDLLGRFDEFQQALVDLGVSADQATQALNSTINSQREAFNAATQNSISQFVTGPLEQLESLFETQTERLRVAEQLGADIDAVERLNALEIKGFFDSLSEQAFDEVRQFLGIFEEATDTVNAALDLTTAQIQDRIDSLGSQAEDFAALNAELTDRFVAGTPADQIASLRDRVNTLFSRQQAGDTDAGSELSGAVRDLVERARSVFGNTQGFQEILAFSQAVLGDAEGAAREQKTIAEQQLDAQNGQLDILNDIRDILSSSEAVNAFFQAQQNGGFSTSQELLDIISSQTGIGFATGGEATATASLANILGQRISNAFAPIVNELTGFSQVATRMPQLQQVTIQTIERGSALVRAGINETNSRLDRIEVLNRKMVTELERLTAVSPSQ